jgi:hypothetical protein
MLPREVEQANLKDLADYQKEFVALQRRVGSHLADVQKYRQNYQQSQEVLLKSITDLRLDVQKIKDKHVKATSDKLEDYKKHKEIAAWIEGKDDFLKMIAAEQKRMAALVSGDFAETRRRLDQLQTDLESEIAARERLSTTYPHLGDPIAPLRALLSEIRQDRGIVAWLEFEPDDDTAQDFERLVNERVTVALKQTKETAYDKFMSELRTQKLEPRLLLGQLHKAQALYKQIDTLIDAAKLRLAKVGPDKKARDNDSEIKRLRKEIAKLYNQLSLIVSPYEENLKDRVLMANVTASPDGDSIIANMNKIVALKRQAGSDTRIFNY